MKATATILSGIFVFCALSAGPVHAQVVRESDVKSIAGMLNGQSPTASWTFRSAGNQILFATLDADIYRMMAGGDDGHESAAEAETEGGCGGEDEGGGSVRFYIEVKDSAGEQICYAERPAPPPGWQRDPRLACVLPAAGDVQLTYSLIVGLKRMGGDEPHTMSATGGGGHPFILNVSLRRIAPTETNIQSAIALSKNGL
jgi:hypothetical protein